MKSKKQLATSESPRAHFAKGLAQVEFLESRRLLTSVHAVISDGVLRVTGTEGADNIALTVEKSILTLKVNGATKTFGRIENTGLDHAEISSLGGNDRVTVGIWVGNVYVNGGSGNDTISGGNGDDTLTGAAGTDYITGGAGRDRLNGYAGNDQLKGGTDVDRIFGGDGNDLIDGEDGTDYLYGENGNDTMNGSGGSDSLDGGAGKDSLDGGSGDDTMFGGSGDDNLTGGSGHDTVFGNDGDDHLNLRDLTSDLADGGAGTDWAVIDDFEKTFVVAEMRMY